jgi:hypothetical protein
MVDVVRLRFTVTLHIHDSSILMVLTRRCPGVLPRSPIPLSLDASTGSRLLDKLTGALQHMGCVDSKGIHLDEQRGELVLITTCVHRVLRAVPEALPLLTQQQLAERML